MKGMDTHTHTHNPFTREDEFLLHDVDVSARPPDSGAQHDLLWVVATHATHPPPTHTHTRTLMMSSCMGLVTELNNSKTIEHCFMDVQLKFVQIKIMT